MWCFPVQVGVTILQQAGDAFSPCSAVRAAFVLPHWTAWKLDVEFISCHRLQGVTFFPDQDHGQDNVEITEALGPLSLFSVKSTGPGGPKG